MTVVEARGFTVRFQSIEVLSDVSFSVKTGDFIGIVGPNGSGKTTLVRSLLGLLDGVSGETLLFGTPTQAFRDWGRVGYLPQKGLFLDSRFPATVREIVASGILVRRSFPRILSSRDRTDIDRVLAMLQIADLAARPIGQLSGGQQQRVLLARALVYRPELLVLDEPTVALDPQTRETFYAALKHLNEEHKTTVLLVSHDIATVGEFAKRLLYLDRRVVFFGSFDAFCTSKEMTDYFGRSTQHVICHRH